jgi:DUF4097 and DUF4098 domain-containing protein YvlB
MATRTFPLTAPISVLVRVGRGSLRVSAVDDLAEASVTLSPRPGATEIADRTVVELRGTTLTVISPRQGGVFNLFNARGHESIDIELVVPSGTPLKISSMSSDITLTGRSGHCEIETGSSAVSAEFIDGDLRLRTGRGDCQIERVSGSAQIQAGSGKARLGEIHGALTSATGSGRLDVGTARGSVRFRTGSGGAALGAIYDDVDLASGKGEMSIGVPAGLSARLELTTGSGLVDSDLPISANSTGSGRPVTIRARTGSGDVRLFRAA